MEKKIQGLMFIRNVGGGKTMLIGVIDTPTPELQGEAQHEFIGCILPGGKFTIQATGGVIDIKDVSVGASPNGLLTKPIWKT